MSLPNTSNRADAIAQVLRHEHRKRGVPGWAERTAGLICDVIQREWTVWDLPEDEREIEVVPAFLYERDVIRLAQEASAAKATLDAVRRAVAEAEQLLSPGMRAGTAEAKAILKDVLG